MNPNAPSSLHAPNVARNGPKRPRRWLPWAGAVLLVAILAFGLRPQPIRVETALVAEGPLRTTVNEEGRTRIRQRFTVFAPVAGYLRRIALKAGESVRENETIVAVLDPLPASLLDARSRTLAEARRDAAQAQSAKAQEALRFATLELQRFQRLFSDRTVSAQELEGVQWREAAAAKEATAALSALRQTEAELAEFHASHRPDASAQTPLQPIEIKAPASGRILLVREESARVVGPGVPLLEIGDPADLEVVIEVLSRDGATIPPGAPVELDHWGGDRPLEARVRLVEPSAFTKVSALGVEEQRVNVIADIVSPPERRASLGDRFRVEARIVVWESPRTLKVPSGGLFRRGNEWAAFGIAEGRTVLRPVRAGRSNGIETQILEGLHAGDEIVLYPGDRVRENARVRPIVIAPFASDRR